MKKIISVALLLVLTLGLLCSCVPSKTKSATKKLEKKGYSVVVDSSSLMTIVEVKTEQKAASTVQARKEGEAVTAIYFRDKDSASAALDYLTVYAKTQIVNATVKQSGKIVYFGTEQAVKDFD